MGLDWFWLVVRGREYGRTTTFWLLAASVLGAGLFWVGGTAASGPGTTLMVNTADDNDDGLCDAAHCSLREAIKTANGLTGPETIQFSIPPTTTIKLTPGNQLPVITDTLTILGNGLSVAARVINDDNRVFEIGVGTAVTLTQLTVQDGYTAGLGGGILNRGDLTLIESTLYDNEVNTFNGKGGAVYNGSGTLTLLRSTLYSNVTGFDAGVIWNESGVVIVDNSTITENSTYAGAGAIGSQGGTIMINNSTLADNFSLYGDDEIYNSGTLYLSNSILEWGCENFGPVALSVNSLVGDGDCGGTPFVNLLLGPLGDYGGPTRTLYLREGSPAIDNADLAYCPETDQRGVPRPDGAGCDIGAFEGFYSPTAVTLTNFDGVEGQPNQLWLVALPAAFLVVLLARRRKPSRPNREPVNY